MAFLKRLGAAALLGSAVLGPVGAAAQAPMTQTEHLVQTWLSVLLGDKCLGRFPGTTKALTTAIYLKDCIQAQATMLQSLQLVAEPPPNPGTPTAAVTCLYPQAPAPPGPPVCQANLTPLP